MNGCKGNMFNSLSLHILHLYVYSAGYTTPSVISMNYTSSALCCCTASPLLTQEVLETSWQKKAPRQRAQNIHTHTHTHTHTLSLNSAFGGSLPKQQAVKSETTNKCLTSLSSPSISLSDSLCLSLNMCVCVCVAYRPFLARDAVK